MPIVACDSWSNAGAAEQRSLVETALREFKANGFVVLENLLPAELMQALDEDFRRYKQTKPEGVTFGRMRAQRDMTVPPLTDNWKLDNLTCHPLVLRLIARYLRNSTNTSGEKGAEMEFAHWLTNGADLEELTAGSKSGGFAELDLMVVVDTPSGAPPQTKHRDLILPGPCASLGVHIPLTPYQAEPLNGAIGFYPGSHQLRAERFNQPIEEVVGTVPPGSVLLYDSFTEHRGLENTSGNPRAALFAWFRVPGVYTGHSEENFGAAGIDLNQEWRYFVRPKLQEVDLEERQYCPGLNSQEAEGLWGFRKGDTPAPWGEERVCFCCNRTSQSGRFSQNPSYSRRVWCCERCWSKSQSSDGPEPHPGNLATPFDEPGRFSEEQLHALQASGMNIKPGSGRHKLTLLRERGYFLPVDPTDAWLEKVSNDPQPAGWKESLQKALGKPRQDGFDPVTTPPGF